MNFDLHGLFKFRIDGTNRRLVQYFSQDYAYFKTNEEIEPDLDVTVSDFSPMTEDCYVIDHKYYVKENYLFWQDRHKIARWSVSVTDIENSPSVHFNGGIFSELFLRELIVEPLIGFKLAQKGVSLLHASGVVLEGRGFIFPADKGVGKTSTVLNLSQEKNAFFLANEPAIISSDGTVYSFPSRIRIYHYNLRNNRRIAQKLALKKRLELQLKYLIYLLSMKYGSLGIAVEPETIFTGIGKKHPLQALILLTKTNRSKINILGNINKKELVKRLVIINQNEMKYFSDWLSAYCYVHPGSAASSYWQLVESNLLSNLANVTCHEIEVPAEYSAGVYQEIYQLLKRELAK